MQFCCLVPSLHRLSFVYQHHYSKRCFFSWHIENMALEFVVLVTFSWSKRLLSIMLKERAILRASYVINISTIPRQKDEHLKLYTFSRKSEKCHLKVLTRRYKGKFYEKKRIKLRKYNIFFNGSIWMHILGNNFYISS